MEELFPLLGSPWAERERRGGALRAALEAWERGDPQPLLEGFEAFLILSRQRSRTVALRVRQLGDFLSYLRMLGRPGVLRWERGDYLRYREHLVSRGLAPQTLVSHLYAVKAFLRFLEWAGASLPPLDLPAKERAYRKLSPLPKEAFAELLDVAEGLPSKWREPLLAAMVLCGEAAFRLNDVLRATVDTLDLASGKVQVRRGKVGLTRRGAEILRRYLDWREGVKRFPTAALILDPEGRPADAKRMRHAMQVLQTYSGRPVSYNLLRITGEARLIGLYGSREASRLLGRLLV